MLICSHILCKVASIKNAVRDFEALGFSLEWGSSPQRAHNALLWFEKGPFIELFELPSGFRYLRRPLGWIHGRAAGARLARWAQSREGWCDVALEPQANAVLPTDPTDLTAVRGAVARSGVDVSRVMRGKRKRPDGAEVRYRFFTPEPADLPFVVSPYAPPQRPSKVMHSNGAYAVERVRMGVSEVDRPRFEALVGDDCWLAMEHRECTAVLEVMLTGLKQPLDSRLLHGAMFVAEGRRGEKPGN
jgi:hypothetical protein